MDWAVLLGLRDCEAFTPERTDGSLFGVGCKALAVLAVLLGLVQGAPANIFVPDERKPLADRQYPWSTIGRLSTGCTGTLIGPKWVLSAAHCVVDPKTKRILRNFDFFYPNATDAATHSRIRMQRVWVGNKDAETYRSSDWAVIELESALGDQYGWMTPIDEIPARVSLIAFSESFHRGLIPSVHLNCQIRGLVEGLMLHDCDMDRGASGGPLFFVRDGAAYLVGINVGEMRDGEKSETLDEFSEDKANIGVPSKNFLTLTSSLNKQ